MIAENLVLPIPREVFTNYSQHKNANIANFVLAVPFEINMTNEICNLNMWSSYSHWHLFSYLLISYESYNEVISKYISIQSWQ